VDGAPNFEQDGFRALGMAASKGCSQPVQGNIQGLSTAPALTSHVPALLDVRVCRLYRSGPRGGGATNEERALFDPHPYARRGGEGPRQRDSHPPGRRFPRRRPLFLVGRDLHARGRHWKGQLATNQHTPFADPFVRPLFGGQEVTSGFSGTFGDDRAEVFGTTLVGTRSLSFQATLKKLADG